MIDKIPFSHDKFFKVVMSNIKLAKALISNFLPEKLIKSLDLDTLRLNNTQFVSDDLKEIFSDIIYECNLKDKNNKKVFISFLLEHKSYFEKLTALQLLRYMTDGYVYQSKNQKQLMPIIPLVIYHGKEKWKYISLEELFGYLPGEIKKFIPLFDFEYLDITGKSEKDLRNIGDTLLKSVLLTQKYIFDKDKLLNKLSTILEVFYNEKERNLLETIIVYIFDNIEEIKIQEILLILPVKIKEEVMTIAQKLKKEGIKEGIKEGEYRAKVKTIINGYKKGLSIDILSALSDLNQEDVKKIIDEHKNQD